MIAGIFHSGSGLGNQLHRYVATRVLALDKGYDFSMIAPENFKGKSIMNLDMGIDVNVDYHIEMPAGKVVPFHTNADNPYKLWEEKTNYYNPEFNFIEDTTIIDGEFQDERYFGHRLDEIDEWLKVEPIDVPDDLCLINFRGGEFAVFPELFLNQQYWEACKNNILARYPEIQKFEVHTDDPILAKQFFPNYNVIHDISINWRSLRHAKHAIIANSSFPIIPRLLKHRGDKSVITVAPRFWARRNTGEWSMPQNYYKDFFYV